MLIINIVNHKNSGARWLQLCQDSRGRYQNRRNDFGDILAGELAMGLSYFDNQYLDSEIVPLERVFDYFYYDNRINIGLPC